MTAVMWFRRDLRLRDNPALAEAARDANGVVALFVIDDALWQPAGDARRAFLVGCLRSLDEQLGGRLVVRRGDPVTVVPAVAREVGAGAVFAAEDFGPYGARRDSMIDLELVGSPYAVPPGEVRTGSGAPYKVFSPFAHAWRAHGWPLPIEAPAVAWVDGVPSDPLPAAATDADLPPAGEPAAADAAERFLSGPVDDYAERRDRPDLDATSRLSPYLKWGCLHPRQLLAALGSSKSHDRFRTELCWREFYADVLHHRPDTARQAFTRSMAAMPVDRGAEADQRFDAWREGRTGYPIVDAGMRQLQREGWMHNRVRMIVASFLVKDLHIHWTRGARHFMQHLVDGDVASNSHGWQWVAGTGTDAAPYFRIFNPVTQSRSVDPDGDYIRRYVEELRDVPAPAVHEPWTLGLHAPAAYPAPIVDHAAEREVTLARYNELRATRSAATPASRRRSRG
jgi:deoxyribodipyrimidine photo-lyase